MTPPTLQGRNRYVELMQFETTPGTHLPGERHQSRLPVAAFCVSPIVKTACETCPSFSKNFACPPHSPWFPEWAGDAESATVYSFRLPVCGCDGDTPGERARSAYRAAKRVLLSELDLWRREGYKVAGAGPCLACSPCALENGAERCAKPDERLYSLESLGVNVTDLTREAFGFELDWSGGGDDALVGAVGCVFHRKAAPFPFKEEP